MYIVLDDNAFMPEKAHEEDAGFDLKTPIDFTVLPHSNIIIDTGVHIEIPRHYAGLLVSKSGLNVKYNITSTGLIDCGYTGSIRVKLYNNGSIEKQFLRGDKISQLVLIKIAEDVKLIPVDFLNDTSRGDNGFGSSGR